MTRRILIVEDVALVAMDLECQALDAGWDVVGPAANVAQALDLIDAERVDAALLDVQVGSDLITPVAMKLRSAGVPIVFGSGHKSCAMLPPDLHGTPCLDKPYVFSDVERLLRMSAPAAA